MLLNITLILVQQHINHYFCPILLIFGVSGCFFNIILFSQKQFRNISCCSYFLFASITMMFVLLIGLVPHAYSAHYLSLTDQKSIACKLRGYFGQSFTMIYRWLMTMACIDRYFASSTNVILRKLTNQYLANRIIIIVILLWMILPLHNLYFLDIKDGLCNIMKINFALYHSLFTLCFGGLFPPLIMIIFIKFIHSNLQSKQKLRQRNYYYYMRKHSTDRLSNTRDHQVLLMLFVQVAFYLFTTIPWMIFLLYGALTYQIEKVSIEQKLIKRFIRYITEILIYIYPTLSFYVYTLTSKTFRKEFKNFIFSILFKRNQHQIVIGKKQDQWKKGYEQTNNNSLIEMDTLVELSEKNFSSQ
ncbi:hypothetical protein I4U23_010717 [Adineta vaga]|nr:hypothetical protein I4U23_010717 [Adineta vaga]